MESLKVAVGYVKYMENLIKDNVDYISSTKVILSRISMHGVPMLDQEVCNLTFGPSLFPPAPPQLTCGIAVIEVNGELEYDHGKAAGMTRCSKELRDDWIFDVGFVLLSDDVAVRFFYFRLG